MPKEIWDAYDRNFKRIENMELVRGEEPSFPAGVYHLVCDILVQHADGEILLMQRDFAKSAGGMWEATACGSALKGETALECARRELREETGIVAQELQELGTIVRDETHSIYVSFLCRTGCRKDAVVLQKGETIAYKWVAKEALFTMKSDELATTRVQPLVAGKL